MSLLKIQLTRIKLHARIYFMRIQELASLSTWRQLVWITRKRKREIDNIYFFYFAISLSSFCNSTGMNAHTGSIKY